MFMSLKKNLKKDHSGREQKKSLCLITIRTTALATLCCLHGEVHEKLILQKKNNRGMMGDMHNMDGLRFSRQTKIIFQIETKISRINGKNDGGFNIFQCKYN